MELCTAVITCSLTSSHPWAYHKWISNMDLEKLWTLKLSKPKVCDRFLHLPLRHYIEFKSSLHSMWFIISSHFHMYTACFHYCNLQNILGGWKSRWGKLSSFWSLGGGRRAPSVPTRFTLLIIHDSWTINVPESNPLYFYLSPPPVPDICPHFIYLPYFMPRFPSFRDLPNTAITDQHQTFTNGCHRHCHHHHHGYCYHI